MANALLVGRLNEHALVSASSPAGRRSMAAVARELGVGNPALSDEFLNPALIAGAAMFISQAAEDGFGWAMAKAGEAGKAYVIRLQQGAEGAHAWQRHGPTDEAGEYLSSRSQRSPLPQTQFTSESDMKQAIQSTLLTNAAQIEATARSGFNGTTAYYGPTVTYKGYYQGDPISGEARTRIVILYDGSGAGSLLTAYPDAPVPR